MQVFGKVTKATRYLHADACKNILKQSYLLAMKKKMTKMETMALLEVAPLP